MFSEITGDLTYPPALQLQLRQQLATPYLGSGASGYDGANWSSKRGYVYFPQLNTQREAPPWARLEMLRRARYLTRNTGYGKRCTRGVAQMIGSQSPIPFTDDKDWNAAALKRYDQRARMAGTFDRAGRYNVDSAQPMLTTSRLIDGDVGIALTESPAAGGMVQFYESHQIGNACTDNPSLIDGVWMGDARPSAYRLLNPDDPSDASKAVDVPATDFILHADFLSIGHVRGISALHHAINNLLDITEIRSDLKAGIKLSNRIGYYIQRSLPTGSNAPKGLGSGVPVVQRDDSGQPILVENVTRGGKIQGLAPGEDIKQLLDQRPHPNSREFLEDLNRDIAWGLGLAPDVLWNIAQIGGASVRYVLADAQVWIEAQQQLLVDQFLHRYWVYFCAKEMKAGRLAPCGDPDWFYKVGWQGPAKLTVDIGRDGKLAIDLHRSGMLTLKRWFAGQGLGAEEELREHVREYALKIKLCQEVGQEFGIVLDPDKVFPPAPGSAPANVSDATASPDDLPAFGAPENVTRLAA